MRQCLHVINKMINVAMGSYGIEAVTMLCEDVFIDCEDIKEIEFSIFGALFIHLELCFSL